MKRLTVENRLIVGLLVAAALFITQIAQASANQLQSFRLDAPADTLTYWEGSLAALPPSTGNVGTGSQIEQAISELQLLKSDLAPEPLEFLSTLLRDFANVVQTAPNSVAMHYDLTADQDMAFYLDGLAPIIQIAVNSPERIRSLIRSAATSSQTPYKTEFWLGTEVFVWDVLREPHIGLAIVFESKRVTLGFYTDADAEDRTYRRLGLLPETDSVASVGTMTTLQQRHPYLSGMTGFIDTQQWVAAMLQLAPSKATDDLALFSPNISKRQIPACQKEWQAIAVQIPLISGGFERLEKTPLQFLSRYAWHIDVANDEHNALMMTLNGHLADYAVTDHGQIASLAFGIDTQALLPVISTLWSSIAEATFECPDLQALQASLGPMNLGAVAMTTALLQGLQGAALSVYDIASSDTLPLGVSVDALLTLSSTDPDLLAAMLTAIPQLQGVPLINAQKAVPLSRWGLPEHLTPYGVIKGQHLAVFLGPQARKTTDALATEPLNHSGWLGAFGNTKRLHGLLTDVFMNASLATESMDATACIELQQAAETLAASNSQFSARGTLGQQGLSFTVDQTQPLVSTRVPPNGLSGEYRLERLEDACQWVHVGTESLRQDGTGGYQVITPKLGCVTWQSQYHWQHLGSRILFSESRSESRDSCDATFSEEGAVEASCVVIGRDAKGFRCLFQTDEGESELYRYIQQEH